jgi:hypothetical protein
MSTQWLRGVLGASAVVKGECTTPVRLARKAKGPCTPVVLVGLLRRRLSMEPSGRRVGRQHPQQFAGRNTRSVWSAARRIEPRAHRCCNVRSSCSHRDGSRSGSRLRDDDETPTRRVTESSGRQRARR